MAEMDVKGLRSVLAKHGQEHLLQFWDELAPFEQAKLFRDLSSINFVEVSSYFQRAMVKLKSAAAKIDDHLQPVPDEQSASTSRMKPEELGECSSVGTKAISEGKVAALLLAGGQGTRLGVQYPKGMYDVNLPSRKTLYQLQAERIVKLQELTLAETGRRCVIPWYIMTSEHTKEKTAEFFLKHNHFGLLPENVVLFEQEMLPCMTFEGKIILSSKFEVARAPDGNGGLYRAMHSAGIVEDMRRRGIAYMHVYCVDNALVKVADPVFLGFCLRQGADCGAKVVQKLFPTEAVGVVCQVDGKYEVVEYSEITLQTAERRRDDGRLMFDAGNTCNHFFTIEFLESIVRDHEDDLLHHVARKKIPYINEDGERISPTAPNGIKMEKFVFDVFRFSQQFAVLEVMREDEFAPLKNGPSSAKDSPASCRAALLNLHYRWILAAGGHFIDDEGTMLPLIPPRRSRSPVSAEIECEISPLVSYAGEGLEKIVTGRTFSAPLYIDSDTVSNGSTANGRDSPQAKRKFAG